MKASIRALVVALLLPFAVGLAQPVYAAVLISNAELNNGQLVVDGSGAVPNHAISVDGAVLGTSDDTGFFSIQAQPFSSPSCRVTVSDGTSSAQATLAGCTPTQPPPSSSVLSSVTLNPTSVVGGTSSSGTVTLSAAAPAATSVALSSSNLNVAGVPASITVAAGSTSASFAVTTSAAVPASTNVTITASAGGVTRSAVLTVTGTPLTILTGGLTCTNGVCALGPGNVGTFFNQAISQSGGTGPTPFTWNLVAGILPDGLTLNDPRVCGVHCVTISGTPTTVQTTTFTVQVQDSAGATAQQAFSLTINPPRPVVITTPSTCCNPGAVGASYTVQLFSDGGVRPHQWALVGGQLPPGLALDPSGLISGTLSAAGTFTFTVSVTDSLGSQATGQFSIAVS